MSKTLYAKIWDAHTILHGEGGQTLLHVGRHLAQDGSRHAFEFLQERGQGVRRPDQTFAMPDHAAPSEGAARALGVVAPLVDWKAGQGRRGSPR